jgi:ribosomal subunit interface protein
MSLSVQVIFQGMHASEAVETAVREKAQKLRLFCPELSTCRVCVEQPHKHSHQGMPFNVRVDVTLPGHELTVTHTQDADVYVAVRDAFDDMKRRLEDMVRRRRDRRSGAA